MMIEHLPAADYHADPAIGSTTAKLALKSVRLFRDRETGIYSPPDRPCFQVGRLAHQMVLEPAEFAKLTTTTGPINAKTGQPYGRETKAFSDWQAQKLGITCIDSWMAISLERMPDEVKSALAGGATEVSIFTEINGIKVKCRPDHLRESTICDLKTIADIDRCESEIFRRGYWFSAAWYCRAMLAETGARHSFRLIFMEKNPPYRWRIYDLTPDYMMFADSKVDEVLNKIHLARKHDDWSDDDEILNFASLPDFADDSIDGEDE